MQYIYFTNPVILKRHYTLPRIQSKFSMKSLFSDNSLVCYKPGTLAPGGIGSVRNSRHKAKHT